ncbi:hypothetical protein CsSME_00043699 [Camellia sinensis var. sinensis]
MPVISCSRSPSSCPRFLDPHCLCSCSLTCCEWGPCYAKSKRNPIPLFPFSAPILPHVGEGAWGHVAPFFCCVKQCQTNYPTSISSP